MAKPELHNFRARFLHSLHSSFSKWPVCHKRCMKLLRVGITAVVKHQYNCVTLLFHSHLTLHVQAHQPEL